MLDALSLLGRQSVAVLWLPVALWTVLALVAEAGLRLSRANAAVGLPVRGAVLAALPLALGLAAVARVLAPRAASAVAAIAPAPLARLPEIVRLPEVVVGGPARPAVAVEASPPVAEALVGLLVVLAAVVAVVGLVRLATDAARLRRMRRALPPAPPGVQARLERARVRLGLTRPVAAVQAPPEAVPFTVGWRRPVVAVPAGLDAAELDAVLTHELAHVEHGDFTWHAAQRVVTAAFAAHPLVHVLGRGLDLERERAADAAVLTVHPGAQRTYADLLSYASLPPPPFALGAAPGSSTLKSRIDAMTRPLSPDRLRRFRFLGKTLGALVLVLAAGLAATMAPSPDPADDFSWTLDRLTVDGAERTVSNSFTSLTSDRFDNLVLIAEPEGTFVISDRPFTGAREAGRFEGRTLRFDIDGHAVVIDAEAPYFETSRSAYVRYAAPTTAGDVSSSRAMFAISTSLDRVPAPMSAQNMFAALTAGLTQGAVASRVVEGLVTDADTREALSGASLRVIDTQVTAETGADGRYQMDVPDGDQIVMVFHTEYETRYMGLEDGQTELNVALTIRNVPLPSPLAERPGASDIFEVAEVQPVLIGGIEGLQNRVAYPPEAKADSVQGRVTIQFIVNEEGVPTDIAVLRSPHERLSEAAIRAVRESRFEAGRQRGEPVKVRFAVPITFRLTGEAGDQGFHKPGSQVVYDIAYSGDLESFVDPLATVTGFNRAMVQSRVAAGQNPFDDLTPGTARIDFRVQDGGRPLIVGDIDASSPTIERYGRLRALTTQFQPAAAGRTGTMTVEVTKVD